MTAFVDDAPSRTTVIVDKGRHRREFSRLTSWVGAGAAGVIGGGWRGSNVGGSA
jgi:hypothetical protein